MKFRKNGTLVGVLALALVWVSAPVESRAAVPADSPISRKEAKTLLRHASSPEDDQKLSAYFERKAQALAAKAQEHEQEAEHYASTPGPQPKVPYPGGWVIHCRFLASEYKAEAQKARAKFGEYHALAAGHGKAAHLDQAVRSTASRT